MGWQRCGHQMLESKKVKAVQSVIESKVFIQSKLRHPNVIQLMAVSTGKSSIYIVSELVSGINLDDILFGEGDTTKNLVKMAEEKKQFEEKQLSEALAYLHDLKPSIIYRDI